MNWNETSIRSEIAKLDKITGLKGAELPIYFSNARHTIGTFSSRGNGVFTFSNHWFGNPDWSEASAKDVIRHEYAHYMDYMIYGKLGHSPTWKKCCLVVGAMPTRLYCNDLESFYQAKAKDEEEIIAKYDAYSIGDIIHHPRYGKGKIISISGEKLSRVVTVRFSQSEKNLGLEWVEKNCKKDIA